MLAGGLFFEYVVKEFPERQLPLVNLRGVSGAHEAPYVALLIKGIQPALGESGGASDTAAPLEAE